MTTLGSHTERGSLDLTLRNGVLRITPEDGGLSAARLGSDILQDLEDQGWRKVSQGDVKPSDSGDRQSDGPLDVLMSVLKRFGAAAVQLRRRHGGRQPFVIEDEYDVQDLLHALLRALFDDVRPEDPTPSRAGASSRMDFLLKGERIMVEAKMASAKLGDKQVGEQLIVDIERYQSRSDCDTLVCFVYDPEHHIRIPAALENDLSRKHGGLTVWVLVVPK